MPPTTRNMMTTSRVDHPINIYYRQKFLRRVMPLMIHDNWGMPATMPMHAGDTFKWRRYDSPLAQTVPLQEGVDPTPVLQGKTDLTSQQREYGAWMKASSWLDLTGTNQDAGQRTEWLADQYRLTIDTLCRAVISGTASSTTCTNGVSVATDFNVTDIETLTETMLGVEARYFMGNVAAGTGQGTSPILPAFVGISHQLLRNDFSAIPGFKYTNQYGSTPTLNPGEFGSITDVRISLTNNAYVSGSNYYLTVIAEEAYGNVKIANADELLIHLTSEQVGSPLKMYSTYGWKATYACKILNDNWLRALIGTRGSRA